MKKAFTFILLFALMTTGSSFAGDVITICGQNVQNFFYSTDRTRTQGNYVTISNYSTIAGRQAKANAIIKALSPYKADIYAFNEVEAMAEGADAEALDILATMMSDATGFTYKVVKDGMTYDLSEDETGTIKSGFIYRADKVEPVGESVSTAYGYTLTYPFLMRLQTFRSISSGEQFSLSMNHFKASTSGDMTADMEKREQNSIALLKGLNQVADPDILLMGDLNSEMDEQCLRNLVDAGFEEQILKRDKTAFSYYYNHGELIDHVFANSTMAAQITDARILYIANPHSTGSRYKAYSDHDPYLVTLNLEAQPAAEYKYTKVTEISAGTPYLIAAPIKGLNVPKPVAINKTYEYQYTNTVTEENGTIRMSDPKSAVIFEDAGDGNYYIKDYYGRYYYSNYFTSSGSYGHNTNVGIKSSAHTFSINKEGDNFKITNNTSGYYLIGLTFNGSPEFAWYNYASLNSTQHLPLLYEYSSATVPTDISNPERETPTNFPRKILQHGRIIIVRQDGRRYSLQGIELK